MATSLILFESNSENEKLITGIIKETYKHWAFINAHACIVISKRLAVRIREDIKTSMKNIDDLNVMVFHIHDTFSYASWGVDPSVSLWLRNNL